MKCIFRKVIVLALLCILHTYASAQPILITNISTGSRLFTTMGGSIYYVSGDSLFKNTGVGKSQFIKKTSQQILDGPIFNDSGKMAVLGNALFFVTQNAGGTYNLWISNGTSAGTKSLYSFEGLGYFQIFKSKLYFAADGDDTGGELWSADANGTIQRITDINPGPQSSLQVDTSGIYLYTYYTFAASNDYLFFAANDGKTGFELWKTNGSVGNASQVIDLIVGPESSDPSDFTWAANSLYFIQDNNLLWKSNGTKEGTYLLHTTEYDDSYLYGLKQIGNYLYFFEREYYGDTYLGRTDGTIDGTKIIYESYAYLSDLQESNGKAIFVEWGGDYYISSFYVTDGTTVTPILGNFTEDDRSPELYPFKDYILYSKNSPEYYDSYTYGFQEAIQYEYATDKSYFFKKIYANKPDTTYLGAGNYIQLNNVIYFTTLASSNYYNPYLKFYKYTPIHAQKDSLKITSLTWIDATTDQDKGVLQNGSVIGDANTLLKNIKRNIRANTSGPVKSVKFIMNGSETIQNTIPFAYAGYSNGHYLPWIPSIGINQVTSIPYSELNGKGFEGKPFTVSFNIIAKEQVTSFTLVNADTDKDMRTLVNGDTIGNINILTKDNRINIRANVNGEPYKVLFNYYGNQQPDESYYKIDTVSRFSAPYTLAGYTNGNYLPLTPKINKHTLRATPIIPTAGNGGQGKSLEITFYVKGADRLTDLVLVRENSTYDSLKVIKEGDIINLRDYPSTSAFNIKANTNLYKVWEVRFERQLIDIYGIHTESSSDYSYKPQFLMFTENSSLIGDYKVKTTPYTTYYNYPYTPEQEKEQAASAGKSLTLNFRIIDEAPGQRILDYYLVNADDDSFFSVLKNGDSLDLAQLPVRHNVKINTYPVQPGSVKIEYDGTTRNEVIAPFALFGDTGGNLNPGTFTMGKHTLKCTPYTGSNGTGTVGISQTITFYIYDSRKCTASGTILREQWNNITGTAVTSIPVNTLPNTSSQLTLFESPQNIGDKYGSRIRGYICAPVTGNYTFWISSNESSELSLSTDDKPLNKRVIAYTNSATNYREWEKSASQKSALIYLEKDKTYYIEALQKEDVGPDHLSVGWQLPNGTQERPIPGNRLSPFKPIPAPEIAAQVITPKNNQSYNFGTNIPIEIYAYSYIYQTNYSGYYVKIGKVEIFTENGKLSDAARPSDGHSGNYFYNWTNAAIGKHSIYAKVYDVNGYIGYSDTINVYIFGNSQPPIVTITSPTNGQSFTAPANITINANASDTDGSIAKVEFYQGTTKLGEDNTSPYSFVWNNVVAGSYTLTAKAYDNTGASTTSSTATITVTNNTSNCTATGTILREYWANTSGSNLSGVPFNNTPTSTSQLTLFEGPSTAIANYGSRIRGYICPPTTGAYTFWIASNDNSELYLSTNSTPTNKVKIAYVTGFTNSRQWDKFTTQKSAAINLVAGTKYYIEAIHIQNGGSDNLAVGWQLPNGTQERPITGSRLSPFTGSTGNIVPVVSITSPSNGQSFTTPANITINANASDSDGNIAKVEFYQGITKLGEDNINPYSFAWNNVAVGSYVITAKATDNIGAQTTSASVSISVTIENTNCTSDGTILREFWTGVTGGPAVSTIPLNVPPTNTSQLTVFEGPQYAGDNYGARYSGYICAPITGAYTFWIASDDNSELWLSTDQNPSNKVKIASIINFTAYRQWDKYPSQKSAIINLVAGNKYYIEALHKENSGGDNLSVGWQLPNGTQERPIPATRLSPSINTKEGEVNPITLSVNEKDNSSKKETPVKVTAYPNPTDKGDLSITIEGYQATKYKVYIEILSIDGKLAHSEKVSCDITCPRTIIPIGTKFQQGIYIINVKIDGKIYSERLMID